MYTYDELVTLLKILSPFTIIGAATVLGVIITACICVVTYKRQPKKKSLPLQNIKYQTHQEKRRYTQIRIAGNDRKFYYDPLGKHAKKYVRCLLNRNYMMMNKSMKFLVFASSVIGKPESSNLIHALWLLSERDVDIVYIYDCPYYPNTNLKMEYGKLINQLKEYGLRCDRLIRATDTVVMSAELTTSTMIIGMYGDNFESDVITGIIGLYDEMQQNTNTLPNGVLTGLLKSINNVENTN